MVKSNVSATAATLSFSVALVNQLVKEEKTMLLNQEEQAMNRIYNAWLKQTSQTVTTMIIFAVIKTTKKINSQKTLNSAVNLEKKDTGKLEAVRGVL